MTPKAQIMDEAALRRALVRMTHEIIERNAGVEDICLVGVKTRGVTLAGALAENMEKFEGRRVLRGYLDITRHRDDLTEAEKQSVSAECHIPCHIRDKTVVIVDDVLYTGRTARAAMEAVFSIDRPKAIQLAVLVDRGHRELPIRPDFVGKNIPTARSEAVSVRLGACDGETAVYICDR